MRPDPILNLFLLVLIGTCFHSQAQQLHETVINPFYSKIVISERPVKEFELKTIYPTSSLRINIDRNIKEPFKLVYEGSNEKMDTIQFLANANPCDAENSEFASGLIQLNRPASRLNLVAPQESLNFVLHLIHAPLPETGITGQKSFKKKSGCDKPQMISYKIWRDGLPDPKPPREVTEVEHLVVHHSAGSNTDTNYLNTVRNIYLLHTQTNGWDDIGYNFLIAPDGTIFNGRDPQGVGDEDDILGAHFCGKNSNTMGVCILGDYTNVAPDSRALRSLQYLLAWKLKKDSLDGNGTYTHPKSGGNLLPVICGHRDGCSTSCPGNSFYPLLSEVKKETIRIADSCGLVIADLKPQNLSLVKIYPNPTSGYIQVSGSASKSFKRFQVLSCTGITVFESDFMYGNNFNLFLPDGLYIYKINPGTKSETIGKLIINKN
ncbi:MAG: N-acetylmuramoyl-L-alanine amidase [Flavobacteriales bacterium]|nr:N-acetylmuramoyl-L-alanine amidase [Flavobacteriales bacterium]